MSIRILLADGHRLVREGIACLLAGEPDIEVVGTADNGRETVAMAVRLAPDLVLCDVALPQLDGVEAAFRIAEADPSVKVLALSRRSDPATVARMLQAGARGFVVKNSGYNELIAAIRSVREGETYLSPSIRRDVVIEFARRSAAAAGKEPFPLTARECEVLQLVSEGRRTREIAESLGVSVKTVETRRKGVMVKLGLKSVAELTKYAVSTGLTSLDR